MSQKEKDINKALKECGFYVLVTSSEMTAREALEAYSKRDGIEKMFRTLKNSLGMDTIRVHSNDSIRSKMLIWFIAGILYSLLFLKTKEIRESNKNKSEFTIPEIMLSLQNIMGLKAKIDEIYDEELFANLSRKVTSASANELNSIGSDAYFASHKLERIKQTRAFFLKMFNRTGTGTDADAASGTASGTASTSADDKPSVLEYLLWDRKQSFNGYDG